jgi:hypothetical protein
VAPLPVKVALDPAQIEGDEETAVTVGSGITTRLLVVELVQVPLLPMTV